jgi:hypothetical protein
MKVAPVVGTLEAEIVTILQTIYFSNVFYSYMEQPSGTLTPLCGCSSVCLL